MKNKLTYLLVLLINWGCADYLDVYPEDKITSANFPQNELNVQFTLNGLYSLLKETSIYDQVLELVNQIDALKKYALFPSYEGLFKEENEMNAEVIFDIQYIRGENSQGSFHDQFCGTGTGSFTRGTRYVPTIGVDQSS